MLSYYWHLDSTQIFTIINNDVISMKLFLYLYGLFHYEGLSEVEHFYDSIQNAKLLSQRTALIFNVTEYPCGFSSTEASRDPDLTWGILMY
jgi:hypothetical protein